MGAWLHRAVGFAVGDGQVSGELNTGSIIKPAEQIRLHRADIIGQYIAGQNRAEMVDLLVHSMGGSLALLHRSCDAGTGRRTAHHARFPMGGSVAVLPRLALPAASIEIRKHTGGVFNQQIIERHGIEFYDLGGTAIEPFKSPADVPMACDRCAINWSSR
jgi:hypothetical protein